MNIERIHDEIETSKRHRFFLVGRWVWLDALSKVHKIENFPSVPFSRLTDCLTNLSMCQYHLACYTKPGPKRKLRSKKIKRASNIVIRVCYTCHEMPFVSIQSIQLS